MTLLHVPDMSCGHCKAAIATALAPISQGLTFDLEKRQVQVESTAPAAKLLAALEEIGFPAREIGA